MTGDPYDPDEARHFQPADPRTQDELGGVLERAFSRERGREPNEDEVRRWYALADDAVQHAEIRLSLAREAEQAMKHAMERYARSRDARDLADMDQWKNAAEVYRRDAREFHSRAERLRQGSA